MEIETPASGTADNSSPPPSGEAKPLSFKQMEEMDLDSTAMGEEPEEGGATEGADDDADDDDEIEIDEDDSEEETPTDDEEESEEEEESEDDEAEGFDLEAIKKEFDEEGRISVKVNGQTKKLTFQEMKNLVSSGWHTRERWQQFETEKTTWGKQVGELKAQIALANSKITPVWEKVKAKDIEGSVLELAKANNMNSLDVRRQLRNQMLPVVAQRLGLSTQDIQTLLEKNKAQNAFLDTQEENEFWRNETERLRKEREQASQPDPNREAVEKFRALQIENGVSNADLQWAVGFQRKNTPEGQEPDLRGENLIDLVLRKRRCDVAVEAIMSVRKKLVKDSKFVDRVVKKAIDNPDWQTSQVARWVYKEARRLSDPSKKTQELAKDISRKALQSRTKASFENPRASQKRPMKFSDFGSDDSSLP